MSKETNVLKKKEERIKTRKAVQPQIQPDFLKDKEKELIDLAVRKTIKEYGETLRLLGAE